MLLNIQSEEYYKQWQKIPYEADTWQQSTAQARSEGKQIVYKFVTENAKSILDCACGIALDYEYYKKHGIKYEGVDITPKFVEAAQKRGAPVKQGDIRNLPYPDNSFDVVYCKDVLMHLVFGDWKKALNEMLRVSKKHVITIEPAWAPQTYYQMKECHGTKPDQEGKLPELLMFFHNVYGMDEVMVWAASHSLSVKKWDGKDPERSAWSGSLAQWQVTIFSKE